MINRDTFRQLVLQWEDVTEQPHFKKASFRVNGKKIFATLDEQGGKAVVKLSEIDQSVFCQIDSAIIYPVPGVWGKQGWTTIELKGVKKYILNDLLTTAYQTISHKKTKPR
jgi:predicted DNA-binding protein (MmcQ/YjbR family)